MPYFVKNSVDTKKRPQSGVLLVVSLILASLGLVACQPNTVSEKLTQPNSPASSEQNQNSASTQQQTQTQPQTVASSALSAASPVTLASPLPKELFTNLPATSMAKITGGTYRPLYLSKDTPMVKVSAFSMDTLPVTNAQFYQFVQQNPKWQKQNIAKLFTEVDYLKHWQPNTQKSYQPAIADLQKPVVYVSWYAANAYCQSQGKKLPTVAQWEYVAQASPTRKNGSSEQGYNQKILDWYGDSAKKPLTAVGQDEANIWGVHNMHGMIWEWTDDFNSNLVSGESRADSSLNQEMFCGAGAAGAVDPSDYAAFMRYGFRSSLQSKFALSSLGFRCMSAD